MNITNASIFWPIFWLIVIVMALGALYKVRGPNPLDETLLRVAFVFAVPATGFAVVWLSLGSDLRDPRPFDFAALAGIFFTYLLRSAGAPTRGEPRADYTDAPLGFVRRKPGPINLAKAAYLGVACGALAHLIDRVLHR